MHRILWEYIRGDYNQFLGGQEKLPRGGDTNSKGQIETSQAEKLMRVWNGHSWQSKQHVQVH